MLSYPPEAFQADKGEAAPEPGLWDTSQGPCVVTKSPRWSHEVDLCPCFLLQIYMGWVTKKGLREEWKIQLVYVLCHFTVVGTWVFD